MKITIYGREKDLLLFITNNNDLIFYNDIGNFLKKIGLPNITQVSSAFSSTVQNVV